MAEKGSNRSPSNSSTDSGSPRPPRRRVVMPHWLRSNLPENSVSAIAPGNVNSLGGNLSPERLQSLQLVPEAPGDDGGSEIVPPRSFSPPPRPPPPQSAAMGMARMVRNPSLGMVAGGDFTMHMAIVYRGEDVVAKLLSFTQNGTRGVCTVTAFGDVCNITLRHPVSGRCCRHEGVFEILTLNGSFMPPRNGGGMNSHGGEVSVTVSCKEGRVIGGAVIGPLLAASNVQLVVGSFNDTGSLPGETCTRKRKQKDVPDQENIGVVPAATHTAAGTAGERSEPGRNEEKDQNAAANPNGQHEEEKGSTSRRMVCPDINESVFRDEGDMWP